MDELLDEARRCRDPERLDAINEESNVLLQSLRDIRREQLIEDEQRYSKTTTTRPAKRGVLRSFFEGLKSGL